MNDPHEPPAPDSSPASPESPGTFSPPDDRPDLTELARAVAAIRAEIGKVLMGQERMVTLLLTALLADGHVLIEGVPGLAKTLAVKLMARVLEVDFSRIQFTPDLMPSDVLGTNVFNPQSASFSFRPGPIFGNLILIDEINRAPAKTQAALFEVMEERQVTLDGETYRMPQPYMVAATQNPIEQEGTYRLPEAQLDRFLLKITVDYPAPEDELRMVNVHHREPKNGGINLDLISSVLDASTTLRLQAQVRKIYVDERLLRYIVEIVSGTRMSPDLFLGASPRASVALLNCAKALAAIRGRAFVVPEDIRYVAPSVLRHRVILTPEREMEGIATETVVRQLVEGLAVPR